MLRFLFPAAGTAVSDESTLENTAFPNRYLAAFAFISAVFFVFNSVDSFNFLSQPSSSSSVSSAATAAVSAVSAASSSSSLAFVFPSDQDYEEYRLKRVLQEAATEDKTVIITTLNEAWAAPNSMLDLFLESFKLGLNTQKLVNHLVIVALDEKAFKRCLSIHKHCLDVKTQGVDFSKEAYFMTPDYLKMMWRRIDFLRTVLEMGFSFVFTDADIMWFRDPFPHFSPDFDFQIACDHFSGNPLDINNRPNGGFNYVRSSNRSIEFYKFWYKSQGTFPGYHDQDVLNFIKHNPYISEIGLKMRFLDTAYFGGFCEPSKDLNKVCTMHANCCFGMESKVEDLRLMMQDWRLFLSMPTRLKRSPGYSWRVPKSCRLSKMHPPKTKKKTNNTTQGRS